MAGGITGYGENHYVSGPSGSKETNDPSAVKNGSASGSGVNPNDKNSDGKATVTYRAMAPGAHDAVYGPETVSVSGSSGSSGVSGASMGDLSATISLFKLMISQLEEQKEVARAEIKRLMMEHMSHTMKGTKETPGSDVIIKELFSLCEEIDARIDKLRKKLADIIRG